MNGDARPQYADLEWRYITALDAEDRGDWTAAISSYDEILGIDPTSGEAVARKQICQARQQLIIHEAGPLLVFDFGWPVRAVSWHPGGRHIAVAGTVAKVHVYDVSGKAAKRQLTITARGFSPAV